MKKSGQVPCIYKEYPILDLQQIYKKACNELDKVKSMGDMDMKAINEMRLEDEALIDFQNAKLILDKRMVEIERTIDDHLLDLYTQGNMHHFEGMNYDIKLEYLMGQGGQLDQLTNKMRLKGLTLSYDVF